MYYHHQIATQVTKAIPELEPFAHILIKLKPEKEGNGDSWITENKDSLTNIDALKEIATELSESYNRLLDIINSHEMGTDKFRNLNGSNLDISELVEETIGEAQCELMTKLAYLAGLTDTHPTPSNEEELEYLKKYHGVIQAKIYTEETW